jgi:hypothetical protein
VSESPGYSLDDPRPIAREAPYTYFLPAEEELTAVGPRDMVQLVFRPDQPGEKWGAERMWVTVDTVDGDRLEGVLVNEPDDMACLSLGARVLFERQHIISIVWAENRETPPPPWNKPRQYWERCLVDSEVLTDGLWVWYLYREEPDMALPDDEYPDSGWRIRAWHQDLSDEQLEERKPIYVALGKVLNEDDSWLHLIDEPVGSAFIRHRQDEPFQRTR